MPALEDLTCEPFDLKYEFIGPGEITISGRAFDGVFHISVSATEVSFEVSIDPHEYDRIVGADPTFPTNQIGPRGEYGILIDPEFYASVQSLDCREQWTASRIYILGAAPRFSQGLWEMVVWCSSHEFTRIFEPQDSQTSTVRLIFEGSRVDRRAIYKNSPVCMKPCLIRNSDLGGVAIAMSSRHLDETDKEVIWLWGSFLTGQHLRSLAEQEFNIDGILVSEKLTISSTRTVKRVPPIPDGGISSEDASCIVEAIRRMIEANFPIEVVIAYLHTSADAVDIETEIALLLLGIYCVVEAWTRLPTGSRGKVSSSQFLVENHVEFKLLRDKLLVIVEAVLHLAKVPSILTDKLLSNIKSLNNSGTKQRLLWAFEDLGVKASDGSYALEYRNKLFHNGYVFRSLSTMKRHELQLHYDAAPRLRNIANAMILSLCGYSGPAVEFARNATFPVIAKPSPFNNVANEKTH